MAETNRFVVAVVDDDHRTLESLADLLEAEGYEVRLYSSPTMVWLILSGALHNFNMCA